MPQLRLSHLVYWFCFPILLILTSHVDAQSLSEPNNPSINWLATFWMLIAAALVFFMNAGFTMLETGFCRTDNAINVLAKNLIVFAVSTLAYWLFGFGLMFGNSEVSSGSFWGSSGFGFEIPFSTGVNPQPFPLEFSQLQQAWPGRSFSALFFFQLAFAGTTATIVSGAVAERIKFWAFLLFSFFLVGISYSLTGHWVWSSQGWLYNLFKFRDFAGSTVVHSVGGMAALVGAWLLKPRDGRFGYNRKIDRYENRERGEFKPHQLGFATLGCLILWLGWFGFNGGSALYLENVPHVVATTMMSGATGGIAALIFCPAISGKPSLAAMINGILGGLVGITASSGYVDLKSAIFIGGISGIVVLLSENLLMWWKIDDPVGAIPVHLFCGGWGTLAVGLFSTPLATEYTNSLHQDSLLTQFLFQLMGWVVVMFFTCLFSLFFWLVIGNGLYYFQQAVTPENNSPAQTKSADNLNQAISNFFRIGREGIRVSLVDEIKGSDGVFE